MQPPKPSSGIGAIIAGAVILLIVIAGWFSPSYKGLPAAAGVAVPFAVAMWLLVSGIAKAIKKPLPIAATIGILLVFAGLFVALGPVISRGRIVAREKRVFEQLSSEEASTPQAWQYQYEFAIPDQFRREEWKLEVMLSRVRQAQSKKAAGDLRVIANECLAAEDSELLEPAHEAAIKALKDLYKAGKAKMNAPTAGAKTGEFPVDDGLRQGFSVVLDGLARAKDANIYVAFENSAVLDAPADFAEILELNRKDPDVLKTFPKGNAPLIDPGNAFSPAFDKRRRATFMTALGESFGQVFDGQLLTLAPLEKGESRKGKVIIDVSSRVVRTANAFVYTSNQTAVPTVIGILFSFQVEWKFKLTGRDGKELFVAPSATSKPSDAKINSQPTDPNWAAYSIMMDSAYYNYSREVTGRFGLTPPPQREVFSYLGPTP